MTFTADEAIYLFLDKKAEDQVLGMLYCLVPSRSFLDMSHFETIIFIIIFDYILNISLVFKYQNSELVQARE